MWILSLICSGISVYSDAGQIQLSQLSSCPCSAELSACELKASVRRGDWLGFSDSNLEGDITMCASNCFVNLFRRTAVLFPLLLMATVTYTEITPSDDAYVNSAAPSTNYGSSASLNLSSGADTGFIRFDLTAVPARSTGASIAKATLKLYVHTVTTAGSFNVDLVNGTGPEEKIQASNEPALGTTIEIGRAHV